MRHFNFCLRTTFLVLCIVTAWSAASAQSSLTELTNLELANELCADVTALPRCGVPGPIMPLNDQAFPVLFGEYDANIYEPVVACAWYEQGRVVAFGHTDYCRAQIITKDDSSKTFFTNILLWVANSAKEDAGDIKVVVWRDPDAAKALNDLGFNAVSTDKTDVEFDVFISESSVLSDEQYDEIFSQVRKGKGFVTCGLGWGWSQLNPDKDLATDHAGNRNFARLGVPLAWTQGFLNATNEDNGYRPTQELNIKNLGLAQPSALLKILDQLSSAEADDSNLGQFSDVDLRQITTSVELAYPFLAPTVRNHIETVVSQRAVSIIPTEKTPILSTDLFERLSVVVLTESLRQNQLDIAPASAELLKAAGNEFPGKVPDDAERLNDVPVIVKPSVPDWTSTGLYAAPGETITISVDSDVIKKVPRPFAVRIGVHKDLLWKLNKWPRFPEITLEKNITSAQTKISNPFGGPIYIVVPHNLSSLGLGLIEFRISGGVKAPYFIKNETSLEAWRVIRDNPAPWAELQGRNIILSVPSEVIRSLDNPQELMETWDQILDLEAELASGPYVRERPERICCDREISAGYMHSGYPVMTHMDVKADIVNNARLRKSGDWGFYHEFGHNHQSSAWTFDGSTEVTVNYFTLYLMEKFNNRTAGEARNELKKESRLKLMKRYFDNGSKFEDWKADPFLALNMTVQLREAFGWEPFIRAISEYKKLPADQLPKNDQEKRDQWMIRLSKNTGVNLAPFFNKWGVHVSEDAERQVEQLPVWTPEEFNEL